MRSLDEIRKEINSIDEEIKKLFLRRMEISKDVVEAKIERGLPILNKEREREVLDRMKEGSGDFAPYLHLLYQTMFHLSKSYQSKFIHRESALSKSFDKALKEKIAVFPRTGSIAVQGIEGSYSQEITDRIFPQGRLIFVKSFSDVFDAVEKGLAEFGILPIENSSNGSVKEVYDLMQRKHFTIVRSGKLQIRHGLYAKKGAKLSDIQAVASHIQALEQCSSYVSAHKLQTIPVLNTAVAAKMVCESDRKDLACFAGKHAGKLYGLECLDANVQNSDANFTRFVCITKDLRLYEGARKLSFLTGAPNRPGGLYEILSRFAALGLNLSKIESRPIPGEDFAFHFYFDVEASIEEEAVRSLLLELESEDEDFSFLGCYLE